MGSINKLRLLRQVRKNQWLKTSELEELQAKKLRAIVKHAYENVLSYREKFISKIMGVLNEEKGGLRLHKASVVWLKRYDWNVIVLRRFR